MMTSDNVERMRSLGQGYLLGLSALNPTGRTVTSASA